MRHILAIIMACLALQGNAQQTLTLDSCRALALRNNKTLSAARLKQDMAHYTAKAAKTKYLPRVDATGGYMLTSREISLLSKQQKSTLSNLGSNTTTSISNSVTPMITELVQNGIITQDQAASMGKLIGGVGNTLATATNQVGQKIVDALRTDTRNMYAVSVIVRQPVYMGGAITAANNIARINERMAASSIQATTQNTLYDIDQTYWTVVSLKHKRDLAESFLNVVKKLNDDVGKMVAQGVSTRADKLKVDVKVNEAEMTLTQAENGLSLSRMLLCQLCGLPAESEITLADESSDNLPVSAADVDGDKNTAMENRPEVKMLQDAVDIAKQSTKLMRASYLPQVALMGGYTATSPNVYNGFERNLSGVWNIGVMVRVPIWNWMESSYKVKASKIATTIASLERDDVKEKIGLQVSQSTFKVKEATKRLAMAKKNVENAEENLRCANLGFKEGVMQTTEVMAAQTAWLQAQSQKIDAEIDVCLSQTNLKKALGTLQ